MRTTFIVMLTPCHHYMTAMPGASSYTASLLRHRVTFLQWGDLNNDSIVNRLGVEPVSLGGSSA